MCAECRMTPCHPSCPNAPDPPTVYTCKHCSEPIVVGDEYTELDGDYYHRECFDDCAASILRSEYGATDGEAEEPEPYDY